MIPFLRQRIFSSLAKHSLNENLNFPILKRPKKVQVIEDISDKNKKRVIKLKLKREKQKKYVQIFYSIKNLENLTEKMEKSRQISKETAQGYKQVIKNLLIQLEQKRRKLAI